MKMLVPSVKSTSKIECKYLKTIKVLEQIYTQEIGTNWVLNIELVFRIWFKIFSHSNKAKKLNPTKTTIIFLNKIPNFKMTEKTKIKVYVIIMTKYRTTLAVLLERMNYFKEWNILWKLFFLKSDYISKIWILNIYNFEWNKLTWNSQHFNERFEINELYFDVKNDCVQLALVRVVLCVCYMKYVSE